MGPRLRKTALTLHVTTSVGWLGAVGVFLVLAVQGLAARDPATVTAVYPVLVTITWTVLVPLALAATLTGLVQSLGTRWGLLRHWWVVVKAVITVPATGLLLLHTGPIGRLGDAAASGAPSVVALRPLQVQMAADAGAALLALLLVTGLAVWKPRGRTARGRRLGARVTPAPTAAAG